jgi:hypothetical protein
MPDNSIWQVPAVAVATDRARYYAEKDSGQKEGPAFDGYFELEMHEALTDTYELIDWAKNNMDWSDVQAIASQVQLPARTVDYQEGWVNGPMEVVDE